MQVCWV